MPEGADPEPMNAGFDHNFEALGNITAGSVFMLGWTAPDGIAMCQAVMLQSQQKEPSDGDYPSWR